jgi:hypothetical protein
MADAKAGNRPRMARPTKVAIPSNGLISHPRSLPGGPLLTAGRTGGHPLNRPNAAALQQARVIKILHRRQGAAVAAIMWKGGRFSSAGKPPGSNQARGLSRFAAVLRNAANRKDGP